MSISGCCLPEPGKYPKNLLLLIWIHLKVQYIDFYKTSKPRSYPTSIDEISDMMVDIETISAQ